MDIKQKVRPVYFELQGYLSQAPERELGAIYDSRVWEQYNQAVKELEEITSVKYERFKVAPDRLSDARMRVTVQAYRTILAGLISRLHAEYFSDEVPPVK